MYPADTRSDVKTQRKMLVTRLKFSLESWRKIGANIPDFSSYIMKTIALHIFEQYNDHDDWTKDKIGLRQQDALKYLRDCISKAGELKHYFLPNYNIIGHILKTPDGLRQCKDICLNIEETLKKMKNELR